jgi:hypothetical protein
MWLTIAELIQPFYAEIRLGECPTESWWWNGIPTTSPFALLIGKPYAELCRISCRRLDQHRRLHYLEQFVDTAPNDAGKACDDQRTKMRCRRCNQLFPLSG